MVLTQNKELLKLCRINRSITAKLSIENSVHYSPTMTMATLNYCDETIFECNDWISAQFTDLDTDQRKQKTRDQISTMITIIEKRCEEMKNTQFARQIINYCTYKVCPVEFKEVCYRKVIELISTPDE